MDSYTGDTIDAKSYIEEEGIAELLPNWPSAKTMDIGVFDSVRMSLEEPLPPDPDDLVRLHRLVRQRKCFTVLEFGVGYSSIVMADALQKNERDWNAMDDTPDVRNRFVFELFAVDASREYVEYWKNEFPEDLRDRIDVRYSPVDIGRFNGRMCHFYQNLPDVVPDFVYLDGPNPMQVEGKVNGLSFGCDERTVMSGDLLVMEPTLLPGTFVLIDGRTNNARFLERNFQREYEVEEDSTADVTTFELVENRLGGPREDGHGGFDPGKSWRVKYGDE
jgi:hypothetical protein